MVRICALSGGRQAGKPLAEVFTSVAALDLPPLVNIDDVDFHGLDAVFCCLPHAAGQKTVASLPDRVKVIDLSADFRLRDTGVYEKWYGVHQAPTLQETAIYGLVEWYRADIARARLVANPGCYPTSALLALMPLLAAGVIDPSAIIIDAKSGVSGAGRTLRESSLAAEVQEGMTAYGIGGHRHLPEIEQGCSDAVGQPVQVTFTPHLVPMNRGILSTIYVALKDTGVSAGDIHDLLSRRYADEPFVIVLPPGQVAATRAVRGSNACHLSVHADSRAGRAVIVSAIDNLVKGASGQAVQNMNLLFGFNEAAGLSAVGMFP
jgi:N-acetyl-gamma-glutamyl-phosphate reductase